MSKKQLSNYKFYPGVIPPAYNEFPNTVALLTSNKDYIVSEATEYLRWKVNTPSYPTNNSNSADLGAALLLANKEFIKEEANAWTAKQVSDANTAFSGATFTLTKQEKCRRDIGYILNGVAYDVALGTNYNSVFLGIAEYNSLEITSPVLTAINLSKTQVLALSDVATNATAISRTNLFYSELLDIIQNGRGNANAVTFTNPSDATASEIAAKDRLVANRDFLAAEVNAWVGVTYPEHNHDVAKCTRDVKYAIDALCYDILYGGNSATYDQAKFFFYGFANGTVGIDPTHRLQTVAAYGRLKTIVGQVVRGETVTVTTTGTTPNTLTQSTAGSNADAGDATILENLVQITADVVNATSQEAANTVLAGITRTVPSITWADSGIQTATNQIINESELIELTASGVFFGYNYNTTTQTKCKRDIGYLIDAFYADLIGGGNAETIRISRMFLLNGDQQLLNPLQEEAVHIFVKKLMTEYVLPRVAYTTTQTPIIQAQVFGDGSTISDAETLSITKLGDLNDIVINLITDGLASLPVISYNYDQQFANLVYGATKCKRDIDYILKAVAYDISLGTNYNAVFVGLAEKNSLDISQTVIDAINASKTQVLALPAVVASASAQTTVNADYAEILDIAVNGSTAADPITFTNPTSGRTASQIACKDKLIANKAFIQAEINAWVELNFPNNDHDVEKCSRDIGYAINALAYDMVYGGNSATYDQARFFSYAVNGSITEVHKAQTLSGYDRFIAIVDDIVTGTTITKTTGGTNPNTLSQVTSGTNADAGDAAVVVGLAQLTRNVVNSGLSALDAVTKTYPSITWAADPLEAATNAILAASETIQDAVVPYSDYTYDETKCIRDTTYVVDAYIYDLTYGGNSLTYYIASQYQVLGLYTVNQPEVEVAVQTFVKQLITDYILDNIYHPSYQIVDEQSVLANAGEAAGQTQAAVLADIVIDVLDTGSSTLPAPVAPDRQGGGLMPNAIALFEANKRYIQEEAIAYIQYSIDNNLFPFVFFTYNATKCRRDISYVLEGYLKDLKNGGNVQTLFNASKYWENGVAQVDGDRQPEVYTHIFIRDLIENYIWANVAFDSRQILVSQVIDNANPPETFANTRIKELSNTILQVIEDGLDYLPTEIANRGYIKVPGYYKLKDFLLVTNNSRNQIMFNFADEDSGAQVIYSEDFDPDFGGALYGTDKITRLIFDVDTSGMMVTDDIQIFVEGKYQEVRLNNSNTDAMERMKVGIPQSMLDADFEYGLQPTKWQAIAQMRNYPSIYEIPGSDTAVTNVTTDASTGTGGTGASLITVTTISAHGLDVGDPITIKALANTVSGFSRAEGSFLVATVPTPTTFTFYAKSKVGTSNGQVLASSATQLRKGGFYTGAAIGSPTIAVYSSGANGTVTTSLITPSGATTIGYTGTPPAIGSPLSGTGIASGTQVTSVVGSGGTAASTALTVFADVGATSVTVNSTTGISTGLLFDRGDGIGISVTNIVGNVITLSGALTSSILGTSANYTGVSGLTSGDGSSATFTVSRSNGTYSATVTSTGNSYETGDTITILGTSLDGTSPTNDATITVTSASLRNFVSALNTSTLLGGTGYVNATGVSAYTRIPKTITASGNAAVSTAQSKFGAGSIVFDGTGDYINVVSDADFGYGTGDFTVESFIRISSLAAGMVLLDQRTGPTEVTLAVDITTGGVVRLIVNGSVVISSNTTVTTNTWTHFALSRASGVTRMFIGGVAQTTTYTDANNYAAKPFRFGAAYTGSVGFNGYADEIRITKGLSRYSTTFTPTTSAFTNDVNTVLLIHADSTIADDVGGSGLTVDITTSSGVVTAVAVNNGGTNFTVGEKVTITNPNPLGAVTAYTASLPVGTLYSTANGLTTTGGTGTGLTVDVTASGGAVTGITINNKGSGYTVNDTITIVGGSTRGAVTATGSLTAGDGYAEENGTTVATTGGTGTGLTVGVTASAAGEVAFVTLTNPGSGYVSATGLGTSSGGELPGVGLTVDIVADISTGEITAVTINNPGSGYSEDTNPLNAFVIIQDGNVTAEITIDAVYAGRVQSISVVNAGTGYTPGDVITIGTSGTYTFPSTFVVNTVTTYDATFTVAQVAENASIEVLTVSPGGAISSISTAGTPITAPTKNFISAFTISEPTTAQIASGNTGITYTAIATLQVTFATAHGLVPGDTITVDITSSGTGAQLAAGPYFVEQVPTPTTLRYTARAAGVIDNTLVGSVYGRPDSFFIHRPFDGGVQLGTASPSHGASALRMSKKYIRYQSGKGVMYNTGALFAPSYDIRSMTASGTAIGSVITVTTDDTDHGCQVGGVINIQGSLTTGYDGTYTVASVITERVLTVVATKILGATTADIGSPCVMSIRNWHGATIRAGIFDDQNGMFWQYDGIRMAVVRRSSTFQLAGTIAINANSNLVTGTNTRFFSQLSSGDKVVIRGMTHVITAIASDTSLTVAPDFRGVVNVADAKMTKVIDLQIPQEDWNLDTLNGAGPSGYNLDVTKMQMIGIQHTWYGAGFIDFMLRGSEGNYTWAHRIRNSNVNNEAYMRSGNQPVRYEVTNEGARSKLSANISATDTVLPLEDTYWFPDAGVVYIGNELVNYTGRTTEALTGCTRAATLRQFTAGSQRSFTAGPAVVHNKYEGVVLVSNTITPNISHWGSAFMIDGQFDADRGYIFNYAATGVSASVEKKTAFLIRLAPSVSNAIVGDLGEKELLNRAQLLLSGISVTSDSGTGAIVVEGVLNPINYPTDPTKITWQGLGTQAAGGQPSFAQIASGGSVTWDAALTTSTATVQGAFTTTITATSFAPSTQSITAIGFTAGSVTATLTAFGNPLGGTYSRALDTARSDFLITTSSYDALTTSITADNTFGDVLTNGTYLNTGTRIVSVTRNYQNISGVDYTRIVINQSPFQRSGSGSSVSVTITFNLPSVYASAVSNARNDFLITQTQYSGSTIALADILSAATSITGNQTISTITPSYVRISGVAYCRVIMSANANTSTTAGTGNNLSITVTSAASALYGRALSTSRQDFLITNTQYDASGIAVGDPLSLATYVTGNQTITQIVRNYITLGGTAYTRIIMSANANANENHYHLL